MYTRPEAVRLTGATEAQLRYWGKTRLLHAVSTGTRWRFSLTELVTARLLVLLKVSGRTIQGLRDLMPKWRQVLEIVGDRLADTTVVVAGDEFLVVGRVHMATGWDVVLDVSELLKAA